MGGQLRKQFVSMLALGAVTVLLVLDAMTPLCSADDFQISGKFQTRATVENTSFDGFICTLDQGDSMSWDVTLVSGDLVNVYLMSGGDYDKLKAGTFPTYFSQYSMQKTDFFEGQLNATGSPYTGEIVLVVKTQGLSNSTSTFDIDVKVTKAPGQQNLRDMICGLPVNAHLIWPNSPARMANGFGTRISRNGRPRAADIAATISVIEYVPLAIK